MRIGLLLPAALVVGCGVAASTRAEDGAPAKLEKHPLTDAKAGEWRRVKSTVRDQTRWYVERVIGAKNAEGQVFLDLLEVSEDGKRRVAVAQPGRWISVPALQPAQGQQFQTDEMVWVDAKDKKVAARHLKVLEAADPRTPDRKRVREVWYSNDVLGNGKVKEQIPDAATTFTTVDWGTMTPEDLKRARAEYRLDPQQPGTPPPGPAPRPPSGGGTGACGAACGGGK
jgi:hypothetical protein